MIFASAVAKLPAAFLLAAASICVQQPTPTVQMSFSDSPPIEINNQTSAELGTHHISTTFSRSQNETFNVQGLMVSDVNPEYRIRFSVVTDRDSGLACIAPAEVIVSITYAPRIFMASELMKGTCKYKAVLQHEVRHVNTDLITFHDLLPQINTAVQDAVNKIQTMGPTDAGGLVIAQNRMTDTVKDALARKFDEFSTIRFNRQQMIDTRAEYMRISTLCAGEEGN